MFAINHSDRSSPVTTSANGTPIIFNSENSNDFSGDKIKWDQPELNLQNDIRTAEFIQLHSDVEQMSAEFHKEIFS